MIPESYSIWENISSASYVNLSLETEFRLHVLDCRLNTKEQAFWKCRHALNKIRQGIKLYWCNFWKCGGECTSQPQKKEQNNSPKMITVLLLLNVLAPDITPA